MRSRVVLLGDPVAHSLSPAMHNAAFAALGLDAVYEAQRVPPDCLAEAIAALRAPGSLGANVTIPHKERVLPHVDRLTETARHVGAVNTIVRLADGRLEGDNTDVAGFLDPLDHNPADLDALRDTEAVVLGSGGAARAVAYALLRHVGLAQLTLVARSPKRAEMLAADLAPFDERDALIVRPTAEGGAAIRAARLAVNATPVGMHPEEDATPWPHADDFAPGQIVYDLIYRPRPTRLLREAAARGAQPIDGLAMLVGQAARAFERWTGRSAPRSALAEAAGLL